MGLRWGGRHCERSAAIQGEGPSAPILGEHAPRLDCFVASLLAMTVVPVIAPVTPRHCERSEAIQ
ncbi:MAG: hypothetical protein LBT00_13565 [Spirochaetaceae bacterium]|nr:hypothetical protein [Spirochaetaceae bacterium]